MRGLLRVARRIASDAGRGRRAARSGKEIRSNGDGIRIHEAPSNGGRIHEEPSNGDGVRTDQAKDGATDIVLACINDPAGVEGGMARCSVKLTRSLFMEVLPKIGDSDRALEFFHWSLGNSCFKHSRRSIMKVVEFLRKVHRDDEAGAISQQWKQAYLPKLIIKSGSSRALVPLLGEMELGVEDWNSILEVLCRSKRLLDALGLFEAGKKLELVPNAKSYSLLILALCKAKRKQEAVELMNELDSVDEDLKRDPVLFNAIVAGHCTANGWEKGFQVFNELVRSQGFSPDSLTYRVLADALVDGDRVAAACELAERIEQPDQETLRIVVHGFLKQDEVTRARDFLLAATQRHGMLKSVTYNCVMDALCRSSRVAEAYELLTKAEELGFQADVFTYNILITGLCKSSMLDEAKGLLEIMLSKGCLPDSKTYGPLFHGLGKAGRVEEAESLLKNVSQACVDVVTYNSLIAAHCKTGDLEAAYSRLDEMESKGYLANVFTYNILLEQLVSSGQLDKASKTLWQMSQAGVMPDVVSFNTIVAGLLSSNSQADGCRAGSLLQEMVAEHGCEPSIYTLNTVISWLCKKKRGQHGMDKAIRMLEDMAARRLALPPNYVSYNTVIAGLCSRGMLDEADRVFEAMVAAGCEPTVLTFNALIRGLRGAGSLDKALRLLVSMQQEVQPDLESYRPVVEELCNIGKMDEALALLQQMPCAGDAAMFRSIVQGLCKGVV